MDTTLGSVHPRTAGDVMDRNLVVVPRQMLVREAARLIHRSRATEAAVVDEQGRFVGLLSPADLFRWVEAGCPEAVVGPALTCPYQVRGRLLSGGEAVICILAHESCPFQVERPSTAGRHQDVCVRQGTEPPPYGTVTRYMTTEVVTARPQSPLLELGPQIVDVRADRVVVLDESARPVGIVSAVDVLNAVADAKVRKSSSGDPANEQY
jgi:CBS domain-containing protein